jgi:hypothetical protein
LCLACPRSRLEEIWLPAVFGSGSLFGIERSIGAWFLGRWSHLGEEESIEQLLSYDIGRRGEALRDFAGGHTFMDVKPPYDVPGEQEFASEQIHLNLASLATTVVDHPIKSDRRGLRAANGVDGRCGVTRGVIAEVSMTELVGD